MELQNSQYPLKITTSGYEVIASGIVHLTEQDVKFSLANIVIKYLFKTDSGGLRLSAEVVSDELVISLHNFNNSLGQGKIEPIEVGTLDGRKLFATFYVNTNEANVRQFIYTFMLLEP